MAEEICLICTLGNRDIQFKNDNELISLFDEIVGKELNPCRIEQNNNNNAKSKLDYYIIGNNFYDITKKIYESIENNEENYNKLKDGHLKIPMIEPVIKSELYDGKIKKVILIASNQVKLDKNNKDRKKDTYYEAKIIKKYIENEYNIEVEIWELQESQVHKIRDVFEELKNKYVKNDDYHIGNFDKFVFEVSGGTPQMREALRLLFLLNDNIIFHEVNRGSVDNGDNMDFYNFQILLEKIKDLIGNYNYTGALSFKEYLDHPKKDEIIGALEYSNYRLNFDFKCANKIAKKNSIIGGLNERLEKINDEKSNTIEKLEYLILELLDNMEIELKNGNYANFLARVYRLEEAMGQYFVLKWFEKTRTKISYKLRDNPASGLINVADIGVEDLNNKLGSYLRHLSKKIGNGRMITHRGVSKLANFIEENCKKKDRFGNPIIKDGKFEYIININTPTYDKLVKYLYGTYSTELRTYKKIKKMYNSRQN